MNRRGARDADGRLALHQAAPSGDATELARLIADGADVAAVDTARRRANTPLWKAVFAFQVGEPELIRLLLDAGADPDCKNSTDRSSRDMALTFDRPGIRSVFP